MQIKATMEDRLTWVKTIVNSKDAVALLDAVDKIWEDGYRSAEAEVTYAITPEEVRR